MQEVVPSGVRAAVMAAETYTQTYVLDVAAESLDFNRELTKHPEVTLYDSVSMRRPENYTLLS